MTALWGGLGKNQAKLAVMECSGFVGWFREKPSKLAVMERSGFVGWFRENQAS
jgi:hypothetical protein